MKFYLGTHMVNFLAKPGFEDVPLFISRNRLAGRRTFPRARASWALDSGGFTELKDYGGWRISPEEYVLEVRRYRDAIGNLDWAAPQDWMCEPWVITGGVHGGQNFAGTREARGIPADGPDEDLTTAIRKHQQWTVANFLHLRQLAPDLPIIPVLQGWQLADYLHCAQLYAAAGIDLTAEPVVGLGSVCRRQATQEIGEIVGAFADMGLRLHGFGVKTLGVAEYGADLGSADSMAWSVDARRQPPLPGHTHKNCANCPDWALAWRRRVLAKPMQERPLALF